MSTRIVVDPKSVQRVLANLQALPRNVALRHYRIALNAWGGVVKGVQVSRAPKQRTGLLKKSPTVKVVVPAASYNQKHHSKPAYVIVGPSRSLVRAVADGKAISDRKATKRVLSGGRVRTWRPSRYAHFVEKGIAGRRRISPKPFVVPSARAGESEGFRKFVSKIEQGLAAEAAKLPK